MTSEGRPNILLVVFDDTGWADFSCFGSEVATPVLDRLAAEGIRYTNFHVTPLCSPTRASLLTGRNPHRVGMGWLSDLNLGTPGRQGRVSPDAAMLPRVLADFGYMSYLVGKWHLTPAAEVVPGGPYTDWPLARGFDRFYGFLEGCTDQFQPELVEDNHVLDFVGGKADYHLTVDLVDRARRYVADHLAYNPGRPFFLELAFGATHAPFQAPAEYIEPYLDVFSAGWDRVRQRRLDRQKEMDLLPEGTRLAPRPDDVPAWDDLTDDQRTLATALQAAFAGFLSHADEQLGRLIDALEEQDALDNTIVVVLSDNGAAHDGHQHGSIDVLSLWNGIELSVAEQVSRIDDLLGTAGRAQYPQGWAMAGNTPFPRYKQFVEAGGVRSPLIIRWPRAAPGLRHQFTHVVDIAPTLVELAGGTMPEEVDGRTQLPVDGESIVPTLTDPDAPATRTVQYFEMAGVRAIWDDGWKAIASHKPGTDYDQDLWRLYDTRVDPSETRDVADDHPARLREMVDRFEEHALQNQVYPLDDRTLAQLLTGADPVNRRRIVLRPESSHLSCATYLAGARRHGSVIACVDMASGWRDGTLVSSGTPGSGYRLAIEDRHLVFEHEFLGRSDRIVAALGKPQRPYSELGFVVTGDSEPERNISLTLNGVTIGETIVAYTARRMSFWGLDVGRSRARPGDVTAPGLITVTLEFHDVAMSADLVMGSE